MINRCMVVLFIMVTLSSCAKHTTHIGRRGPDQAPVATPPPAPELPQVTLEAAEMDSVPRLVTPIIKSVWIMPHQTTAGDFVGAYILHMVVRPATVETPSDAIVHLPALPKTEVAPPLIAPPAVESQRQQYELHEGESEPAPPRQPLPEGSESPLPPPPASSPSPSSGRPSNRSSKDLLMERGKATAEYLRQKLPGATTPPWPKAPAGPTGGGER